MKSFKTSIIATLLISFVALLAVGCGDSREDFVATNTNNTISNGNLNFRFVRAQTTTIADATTDLLFEFRNTANELVFTRTVSFASPTTEVTINGVPSNAVRVEITALQNGFPVGTVSDDVVVNIGQTTDVDLTNATTAAITFDSLTATPDPTHLTSGGTQTLTVMANFSDTSSVTVPNANVTFTPANTAIANVSAAGVVSSNAAGGNTTVDAAWTFNNVTQNDEIAVTVGSISFFKPDDLLSPGSSRNLTINFVNTQGETVENFFNDNVTFTVVPATTGVTLDGNDLDIDEGINVPTTFTLQASFVDTTTNVTHTVTSGTITVSDND